MNESALYFAHLIFTGGFFASRLGFMNESALYFAHFIFTAAREAHVEARGLDISMPLRSLTQRDPYRPFTPLLLSTVVSAVS